MTLGYRYSNNDFSANSQDILKIKEVIKSVNVGFLQCRISGDSGTRPYLPVSDFSPLGCAGMLRFALLYLFLVPFRSQIFDVFWHLFRLSHLVLFKCKGSITIRRTAIPSMLMLVNLSTFAFLLNFSFMR